MTNENTQSVTQLQDKTVMQVIYDIKYMDFWSESRRFRLLRFIVLTLWLIVAQWTRFILIIEINQRASNCVSLQNSEADLW